MRLIKKFVIGILIFVIVLYIIIPIPSIKAAIDDGIHSTVDIYDSILFQNNLDDLKELAYQRLQEYGYTGGQNDFNLDGEVIKFTTKFTIIDSNWVGYGVDFNGDGEVNLRYNSTKLYENLSYPYEEIEVGSEWEVGIVIELSQNTLVDTDTDGNRDMTLGIHIYIYDLSDETEASAFEGISEVEGVDKTMSELVEEENADDPLFGTDDDIEEDESILINAICNFVMSVLDAAQSLITELMLGINSQAASVTVSDISLYPNLNIRSSSNEPDWWLGSSTVEDSEEGIIESSDTTIEYYVDATNYASTYKYINMAYSPEAIFSGEVDLLSINFFETTNSSGVWGTLRNVIVSWFRALRYIALAGLLSALIYIGIKIMLTASPTKRVDYKQAIMGWVIGIMIVFLLPYIMSFLVTMGDKLVDIFSSNSAASINVYVYDGGNHKDKSEYAKFSTNLMGLVRFQAQTSESVRKIGYIILYFMLIVVTVRFTVVYIKRMIYMAYLTLISPLVALMYPIDNVNTGGAKGFNEWFKGYLSNILIQPIHVVVYFILVTSAMEFAVVNPLYTIIALGLISELENLIKGIFGLGSEGLGSVAGENTSLGLGALFTGVVSAATAIAGMISSGDEVAPPLPGNNSSDSASSSNSQVDYEKDFKEQEEKKNKEEEKKQKQQDKEEEKQEQQQGIQQMEEDKQRQEEEKRQSQDEEENKKDGKKGVLATLREMARRRAERAGHNIGFRKGDGAKKNAINIAANLGKRTIKGVVKGAKFAGTLSLGIGAATLQAAYSIASDGKYSPLEGITTAATVASGSSRLIDKAGGKFSNLASEYKKERMGDKEAAKASREKNFRNSKQVYDAYEKEYSGDGKGEVGRRLNIGQQIAGQGIEDTNEQIAVMNYMDSMVDKDYQQRYGKMDEAQRDAEADKIRRGNKDLKGLSTEDTLKWNMRKNDDRYLNRAVATSKARSEIPKSVINGSEKDWQSYVSSMSAGNERVARGYESARKNIREMNAAQRRKK